MSLFMDVHHIEGGVSAADVAGAHEADLATQGAYGVNYLRYWVDEEAGKIFCLVEAPDGDPVALRLSPGWVADVQVVTKGTWADAVALPGLGADLLEGTAVKGAAAFETWLLAQQRHAAAASEAILHEAALGSMARGALTEA